AGTRTVRPGTRRTGGADRRARVEPAQRRGTARHDDQVRAEHAGRRSVLPPEDRLEDRDRRARREPETDAAARVVHRVRAVRRPEGGRRGDRGERWEARRPGRHRWCAGLRDRSPHDEGGIGGGPVTLSAGLLLADRYRLDTRIAVGGMGEVWQASDTRLDRTVAVKILKAELSGDAEFLHRFRTEARTTASLNHPGIAAVHDYGEASSGVPGTEPGNDMAYLAMQMVSGEPLAGILAREVRSGPELLLPILEQAARALNAAHERGLVHRDVKPGYILVGGEADGSETVKITDFGIAKAADAAPVTRNGMVIGTAHYIAPEQATGQEATPASDVYSLAVCGYECLAGRRPFVSENAVTVAMMHIRATPPALPPDVPPTGRARIDSTLVKHPAQRYANGGEFADAVAMVRA